MPAYTYKARETSGKSVRGSIQASSPRAAREHIRGLGLRPSSVIEGKPQREQRFVWRRRAPGTVVARFVRDLSTLLTVGTPLSTALRTIRRQYRGRTGAMIEELQESLSSGRPFAESVAEHPDHFDAIGCAMVRVGEATGDLAGALDRYAELKENWAAIGGQIIGALLYPAVVTLVGIAVAIFLMTTVVPDVVGLLEASGQEIPWPTAFVLAISNLIRDHTLILAGVTVAVLFGAAALLRTSRGREHLDLALNSIPVLGDLRRRREAVRLTTALSAMLRAGVALSTAIPHARNALSSPSIRRAIDESLAEINRGSSIAAAFAAHPQLPPVLAQTFAVGEDSGELPDLLARFAESQRRQIDGLSRRLSALVEPVSILVLAAFIGMLMVATILPVLEAGDAL